MASPIKDVVIAVHRICEENKDTLQHKLTYFGLQNLIKEVPAICVVGERSVQIIKGAPTYRHTITVRLVVFFANLSANDQSEDNNYLQSMEFGEKLQDLFNAHRYAITDKDGKPLLLFLEVTAVETGIAAKDNTATTYRTVSVTLEGFCDEIMPTPVEQ